MPRRAPQHLLGSLVRFIINFLGHLLVPTSLCNTKSAHRPITTNTTRSPQNLLPKLTAICAIKVPSPAPCQWVSPAGMCTTSPTINRFGSSPLEHINPVPIVTVKICPRSCVCQKVRAPGVKQTLFPMQSSAVKMGSMWTVPEKVSVGWREAAAGLWAPRMSCILGDGLSVSDCAVLVVFDQF